MKKIFILLIFLGFQTNIIKAQSQFWLGFGYNMCRFKLDNSLNYVIDRYNETRTGSITKKMNQIHFADGLAFSCGFNVNRFIFDFGYTGKKQTVSTQGVYSGVSGERYLRFKNRAFNMGLGYAMLNSRNSSLALCMSFDFGKVKTETKSANIDDIKNTDFETITDDFEIGNTIYFQLLLGSPRGKGLAILARPYYHFSYLDIDFSDVNQTINPKTYSNDPYPLNDKTSNFGISFILALYGSGN